ncbi:spore coat U domain-containing protein [Stenotrophomonas sp.]|uniref:Csu type fimbrial protein n=1 Tax=Stenotrophomonas sp. TaxID=69392 RepID=UPI0028A99DBF|nr:spore coat U domain-containing protein [Stenotrophomonas sp.]
MALHRTLLATTVGALMAPCVGAQAATQTTQFQVRIVITESCDIQAVAASDIDFGTLTRSTGVPVDAQGTLEVNCSNGTPYTIGMNPGANATSTTAAADNRRMSDGNNNFVAYGLYRDAGRQDFWGEVIGTDTLAGTGTASAQTVPVYGRAPSTDAPAGSYSDTVIATITY